MVTKMNALYSVIRRSSTPSLSSSESTLNAEPETSNANNVQISVFGHKCNKLDIEINETSVKCAEDIVIKICQQLKIRPLASRLFCLYHEDSKCWISSNQLISTWEHNKIFELRIRFKPNSLDHLREDAAFIDYLFFQVRNDFRNKVKYDSAMVGKILGVVVADILRFILEEGIAVKDTFDKVTLKEFLPKMGTFDVQKIKTMKQQEILDSLHLARDKSERNLTAIKIDYINGVIGFLEPELFQNSKNDILYPNYFVERFEATFEGSNSSKTSLIEFRPHETRFRKRGSIFYESKNDPSTTKGSSSKSSYLENRSFEDEDSTELEFQTNVLIFKSKNSSKEDWALLCTISDLSHLSVPSSDTRIVHLARKNGIRITLNFGSRTNLNSFLSLLERYYCLIENSNFCLCDQVSSPLDTKLKSWKCHGPVGQNFVRSKLQVSKSSPGSYTLRLDDIDHNTIVLEVLISEEIQKIKIKFQDNKWIVNPEATFDTLQEAIQYISAKVSKISLKTCVRPSASDQPELLLLCRPTNSTKVKNSSSESSSDRLMNPRSLDFDHSQVLLRSNKFCVRTAVHKRSKVVVKELLDIKNDLEWFNSTITKWTIVKNSTICDIRGVILWPPTVVLEHFPLGALDKFLAANFDQLQLVDLVQAALSLSQALWYLQDDCKLVHGAIRCHNLLVTHFSPQTLKIKLSDSFFTFDQNDIKNEVTFLAPELLDNFRLCQDSHDGLQHAETFSPRTFDTFSPQKLQHDRLLELLTSFEGDVWAMGTTLWQIFSAGQKPKSNIQSVLELAVPIKIDSESDKIWQLINNCWNVDKCQRLKPQHIVKNLSDMSYELYNEKRGNDYATINSQPIKNGDNPKNSSNAKNSSNSKYSKLKKFLAGSGSSTLSSSSTTITNDDGYNVSTRTYTTSANSSDMNGGHFENFESPENVLIDFDDSDIMPNFDQERWIIDISQLSSERKFLGQGFYGEVTKGKLKIGYLDKEDDVAVKRINCNSNYSLEMGLRDMRREIEIMIKLRHKHVVQIKGFVEEPNLMLVMEYCDKGSMTSYLKNRTNRNADPPLAAADLIRFSLDIISGMIYLQSQSIVHRDLAARNVLISTDQDNNLPFAKISDFGLAQLINDRDYYKMTTTRGLPFRWYAPEIFRTMKFSHQSDVWSFGVTLWEMFSFGKEPIYPGNVPDSELLSVLESGIRLPIPADCPPNIYSGIMIKCWNQESKDRPSFLQLKNLFRDLDETRSQSDAESLSSGSPMPILTLGPESQVTS